MADPMLTQGDGNRGQIKYLSPFDDVMLDIELSLTSQLFNVLCCRFTAA